MNAGFDARLVGRLAKKTPGEAAVAEIARRHHEFVGTFERDGAA